MSGVGAGRLYQGRLLYEVVIVNEHAVAVIVLFMDCGLVELFWLANPISIMLHRP